MFGSRKREIQRLRQENKLLREAISPLTSLGIPVGNISTILRPYADSLKPMLKKMKPESSFRSSGTSASSPIKTNL
jgi:hypothetical protein